MSTTEKAVNLMTNLILATEIGRSDLLTQTDVETMAQEIIDNLDPSDVGILTTEIMRTHRLTKYVSK